MMYFNPRSREGSDHTSSNHLRLKRISIHAPAKGATRVGNNRFPLPPDFNPRSREGSDDLLCRHGEIFVISIHAPAKGATTLDQNQLNQQYYFNPRSREGSDVFHLPNLPRRSHISIHAPAKGATQEHVIGLGTYPISIHAPAKGATGLPYPRCYTSRNFNPRSREGSDRIPSKLLPPEDYISIHAPVKGATCRSACP